MLNATEVGLCAEQIKAAADAAQVIEPFSTRLPGFDLADGYAIQTRVHQLRLAQGARAVGRKIGFTNPEAWPKLGVSAPAWSFLYAHTVLRLDEGGDRHAPVSLSGMLSPRIEPEVVLGFARAPAVDGGVAGVIDAIDWISTGFELVQSNYAGQPVAADAVANAVYHGGLVLAPPIQLGTGPDGRENALRDFTLTLACDDQEVARGQGRNVLGSPLQSVLALAALLAQQGAPAIQAGEIITTGTVTPAFPVQAGQRWSLTTRGIELPDLSIQLTD